LRRRVEIELSSKCNALCPGCRRTIMDDRGIEYEKVNLDEQLIYKNFESLNLEDFSVKLCGVLGDPILHPKMIEITRWLANKGSNVQISTNASLQSEEYWKELGHLSCKSGKVYLHFSVDGLEETNSLYRVNTSYSLIERNMKAYSSEGGSGAWVFIEFDYNQHQKDEARKIANELGFEFYVRRAAKNSVNKWKVPKRRKDIDGHFVVKEKGKHHQELDTYKKILKNDYKYDPKVIDCKYKHGDEFFLTSTGMVWPCCYLWDEFQNKNSNLFDVLKFTKSQERWNDLAKYSFEEIFENSFYRDIENIWNSHDMRFQRRCYSSCGSKGKLRNSFSES